MCYDGDNVSAATFRVWQLRIKKRPTKFADGRVIEKAGGKEQRRGKWQTNDKRKRSRRPRAGLKVYRTKTFTFSDGFLRKVLAVNLADTLTIKQFNRLFQIITRSPSTPDETHTSDGRNAKVGFYFILFFNGSPSGETGATKLWSPTTAPGNSRPIALYACRLYYFGLARERRVYRPVGVGARARPYRYTL